MGQRLLSLAQEDPLVRVVAALEGADHPQLGEDAGQVAGIRTFGLPLTHQLPSAADVVIDFSVPAAAAIVARHCGHLSLPLVIATTGLDSAQRSDIEQAAERIPVVWAPSMSAAVNVAMRLTEIAARSLRGQASGVDVEIIERHHRFKEDAPSGTALRFGEIVAEAMGPRMLVHGRSGRTGPRSSDEIGFHAIRAGDNPGEHTIVFGMLGETLEIKVKASNRDCYALGALAAAKFVVHQPPGIYSMLDVLGLNEAP